MKRTAKNILSFVLLFWALSCSDEPSAVRIPEVPDDIDLTNSFFYQIDLSDRSDDTFKVRMFVAGLTDDNKVFQFPATVPGVYDIFDIGRFVVKFKAFDEDRNELAATKLNTNQWELSNPAATHILEFEVKETFDTNVTTDKIYLMGGTSIESDHALLNTFDVLGYPTGLKEHDFYLEIKHPSSWKAASSLQKTESGYYYAENYDKFVDSPILLGDITIASVQVDEAIISLNTYSKSDVISSGQILNDVKQVMLDASAFLKGLPVDRYNFIYFFEDNDGVGGALEHSYSSVYTLDEEVYTPSYGRGLRDISAHEFFHIVTPLNIHSEIIEDFNFADPTPSRHLWLYEGVTEWASLMMQYRNGSSTLAMLLNEFKYKKFEADTRYSASMSLVEMSLTCYTPSGSAQFGNVYNKGALVAALLDIKLLELSGGESGLRELILELIETYGAQSFSEENFFDDLIAMTDPSIATFIDNYIEGTTALPLEEYFAKIGIVYVPESRTFLEMTVKTEAQQFLFDRWKVNL